MKATKIICLLAASAALFALSGCKQATESTPAPKAPTAWESLTAVSLPLNFDTGTAPANASVAAGYLNTYASALNVGTAASTLSAANRRTFDFAGAGTTAWESPAVGFSVGAQSLGVDIATDVTNGRVGLTFDKLNFGTLTASSGVSFDLELPLNNSGFIIYLRQCDATGAIVKTYTAKINGGFSAADDWFWYWNPGDHWNSFKVPLSKFTSGDNGTGTTAAADIATFTPNKITFEFRLDTGAGNGIDVNTKAKAWFDNLATY